MKNWQRVVDRLITDSIGDGDVSHLPGAGKKLALSNDSNTPEELRAAFKIMDDHNVTPQWIEAGLRLEQLEAALRHEIETRAAQHLRDRRRAGAQPPRAATVHTNWNRFSARFLERVERYNREVLLYNLTLPSGIPHRRTMRGALLIKQALRRDRSI